MEGRKAVTIARHPKMCRPQWTWYQASRELWVPDSSFKALPAAHITWPRWVVVASLCLYPMYTVDCTALGLLWRGQGSAERGISKRSPQRRKDHFPPPLPPSGCRVPHVSACPHGARRYIPAPAPPGSLQIGHWIVLRGGLAWLAFQCIQGHSGDSPWAQHPGTRTTPNALAQAPIR